ncbi:MAG: cytochrome c biogenesis CcdA family protein [Candidatus Nanohalobium sp.]
MKIELNRKWALIGATIALLLAITAGFTGFYTFIVPKLVGLSALQPLAIIAFAVGAGSLSFFAPCSVAIFPSYMGYYLSETDETTSKEALKYGLIASSGMVLFYGVLGIFISYIGGMSSVQTVLNFGIPAMAVTLAAVGLYFITGMTPSFRYFSQISSKLIRKSGNTSRNLFLFGFGYSMSSIACIFPVFLLLIIYPFLSGNFLTGSIAFLAFAAGKSAMMVSGTLLTSKSGLLTGRLDFNYVKKGSGLLILLVAIYLAYYSLVLYGVIAPI